MIDLSTKAVERKAKMFEYEVWLDTPESGEVLYYKGSRFLAESAVEDFRSMSFEAKVVEVSI
jgi:hypothetical protein